MRRGDAYHATILEVLTFVSVQIRICCVIFVENFEVAGQRQVCSPRKEYSMHEANVAVHTKHHFWEGKCIACQFHEIIPTIS